MQQTFQAGGTRAPDVIARWYVACSKLIHQDNLDQVVLINSTGQTAAAALECAYIEKN